MVDIVSGDTIVPAGTSDGAIAALKIRPPINGQLCVGVRTTNGVMAACGVTPMLLEDDLGFSAKTSDGGEAAVVTSRFSFIAMTWIDESTPYRSSLATYNDDKDYYLLQRQKSPKYADGLYSPTTGSGRGIEYCKHPDGTFPVGMTTKDVGRPPPNQEMVDDFEALLTSFKALEPLSLELPEILVLAVDNSGSMSTGTIQPAYSNLKDYVSTNYPSIQIKEYSYGYERWLLLLADAIENAT